MTNNLFQQAIGLIDDDLISEAATSVKDVKIKLKINWKISMIAACIAVIIYISPNILELFKANAEDPNWHKYHTYAYSEVEAVEKFGDDLLLDRIVLKDYDAEPDVEFILEHEEGGANDRDTWSDIGVYVRYKDRGLKYKKDGTTLRIFFKEDNPSIDGKGGYRDIFTDGFSIVEINGVEVKYEKFQDDNNFPYVFAAEFKHNGYIYFLITFSKNNEEMFWDTIRQMLDD